MKVLHINFSDLEGGAAIAGYRLHRSLRASGVESRMLVGTKRSSDETVMQVPPPGLTERLAGRITKRLGLLYVNIRTTRALADHPWVREADLINLHNLHGGYFNYRSLPSLAPGKPMVLTLHDLWAFTGHCSYSFECTRFITGCGNCPHLDVYPCVERDATATEWRWKEAAYRDLKLCVVSSSRWLADQAKQSMLGRFPVELIPLGLDTKTFAPLERAACRSALGLPMDKHVLLFAAAALNDPRKGADLLVKALVALPGELRAKSILLTMGAGGEGIAGAANLPAVHLGYVEGDRLKAVAYSAAELFVFPTRADIFGLVLQESIACGTPAVSFRVGGVPDLVRPGITGDLADAGDARSLADRLASLLQNPAELGRLRDSCRAVAMNEYSDELMARRYRGVYDAAMARSGSVPASPQQACSP